ncbi:non-specific lipid transfer protein GPI-anchored 2 [Phtheirospermum japonicum]|uniref:Non-specific lipid transfer protein GPI-anchored 2 n=1 Tax=Phtheirospermum japonicum TaxID=374723 RepID=A0A830C1Z3_9LAMI|nr:non-specific lipid transfer protein GPI-anchored 2 [Phtheirospermum japonicum]
MAKTTTTIAHQLIIAAIFAVALPRLAAQPPSMSPAAPGPYVMAPSPSLDCFTYLIKLSDCLTFVEGGSNLTKPDPGCCPELANLVDTQPICLCQLLGNPGQVGLSVDVNRALQLPSVCNVTTPPVSLCAAIGIPVGDLAPSEAPSAGGSSVAASPSPGGRDNGSAGNSLASTHHFLIGSLATVFFTYFL